MKAKDKKTVGLSQVSDRELMGYVREGNLGAFNELAERYKVRLYNFIYRVLPEREEAEDILQETFLRAYTRMETFDPARPFPAWIRRIATNLCIDRLRRRREDNSSLDQYLESGRQYADERPETSPAEAMEMAEDSRRVLRRMPRMRNWMSRFARP